MVKFDIGFKAASTANFKLFSGAIVRGFVYSVVARYNRRFASELHASRSLAPFSTTPLFNSGGVAGGIEKGESYSFRVVFFSSEIGEAFRDYFMKRSTIRLAGENHKIERIEVEYVNRIDEQPSSRVRVNFLTPTCFRVPSAGYRFLPLPYPPLMMRSLARIYEGFYGRLPENYRQWLDVHGVALAGCSITTEKIMVKRDSWNVGFKGEALLSLPKDAYREDFARVTSKLLRLGCYTNVGGGRTSGMGVMEVEFR